MLRCKTKANCMPSGRSVNHFFAVQRPGSPARAARGKPCYMRSNSAAMPWPPPMHMVTSP